MALRELFPPINPNAEYRLRVGSLHEIYVEESGNPAGTPVVFLHGGPGSGCKIYHRQFFDPQRYRIVLLDQRGCGRSAPLGEITENTTQDLIADLETIRTKLDIDKWVVFGGSWGSALGLVYAETFPDRILAMILRGSFLAAERDMNWFFADGVRRIFPDAWQDFVNTIPEAEREDIAGAMYRRVVESPDREVQLAAAKAWMRWAGRIVMFGLGTQDNQPEASEPDDETINKARIECHYAYHRYFLESEQIFNKIKDLYNTPVSIVHGRRDLTCPLESSWRLHQLIPGSELIIVPGAGHLASEPAMVDALVNATDRMALSLS
jgi:proline iminopeptidase